MDALKDHNAPETKVCNACGLPRAREAYGSKQWKARSVRRCTECAAADRPVRAKAPPVPTAPAPAPARRSNTLTQEEKESAERLRDGAPMTYKIRRDWSADAPSFVMPRVSSGSEPELRRLGRSLGLRMNAKHYFAEDNDEEASTELIAADVSFAGVKFAFDRSVCVLEGCDLGSMVLVCCLRKGRPFVVFKVGSGENWGCDVEASTAEIEQLSRKLGLARASPAELVATLLAAVCPNFLAWPPFYSQKYGGGYFDVSRENNPILTEAVGLLADPWRRRGSDKPGVPPESGAPTSYRALLAGAVSKMREVSDSDSDEGGISDAFIENPFHSGNKQEQQQVLDFVAEYAHQRFLARDPIGTEEKAQDNATAEPSPPEETSPEVNDSAARTEARLERSLARRRCDVCGLQAGKTERPFQVCNGCRGRRYCSRACQKADWASRKQSCAGYNTDV